MDNTDKEDITEFGDSKEEKIDIGENIKDKMKQ